MGSIFDNIQPHDLSMATINFTDADLTVSVPEGTSFITVCDENDTDILMGCRDAACGTCLIEVLKGFDALSPITDQEEILLAALAEDVPNARLACQCRVAQEDQEISVKVLPS